MANLTAIGELPCGIETRFLTLTKTEAETLLVQLQSLLTGTRLRYVVVENVSEQDVDEDKPDNTINLYIGIGAE